jgi:hypothetical protein
MKTNFLLKEDFLDKEYFDKLKKIILAPNFPWYFKNYGATENDQFYLKDNSNNFHYYHQIYQNFIPTSNYFEFFLEILREKNIASLIDIKIISYTNTNSSYLHLPRIDYSIEHKCLIIFLNDCNGGIEIDSVKIEPIENRAIEFNGNDVYRSCTCTNSQRFSFIKINYIK